MRQIALVFAVVLAMTASAVLIPAVPALACPVCDSETGAAVRAGIFDEDFLLHVASVLLPFPVLIASVALVHRGGSSRRRSPS